MKVELNAAEREFLRELLRDKITLLEISRDWAAKRPVAERRARQDMVDGMQKFAEKLRKKLK